MEKEKRFLAPIYSTSVVQIVIDRISNAIISGELKPGDKLPTEPELASLFQVGRNSVREAVRILIAYGVLEIKRPEGTFVCTDFSAKMINPMLYHIILQKENAYDDLIELRKMVENGIMHIVLEKDLTPQEVDVIQRCCDSLIQVLKTTPDNTQTILDLDIAFHDEMPKRPTILSYRSSTLWSRSSPKIPAPKPLKRSSRQEMPSISLTRTKS